jgi:hypothetical protein
MKGSVTAQPAKTTLFARGAQPAFYEVMSASWRSRQKPRFLPAFYEVMSAEIAAGNFSQ